MNKEDIIETIDLSDFFIKFQETEEIQNRIQAYCQKHIDKAKAKISI